MGGFSLSERCFSNYRYSEIWRHVFRLMVTNFSKERSTSHYDPPKRLELVACILHEEVKGSGGTAPVIFRLISFTPRQPYVRESDAGSTQTGGWVCSRTVPHISKNLCLLSGIAPRLLSCSGRSLVPTPTELSPLSYNKCFYWCYDYTVSGPALLKYWFLTYWDGHFCEDGQVPMSKSFVLVRC